MNSQISAGYKNIWAIIEAHKKDSCSKRKRMANEISSLVIKRSVWRHSEVNDRTQWCENGLWYFKRMTSEYQCYFRVLFWTFRQKDVLYRSDHTCYWNISLNTHDVMSPVQRSLESQHERCSANTDNTSFILLMFHQHTDLSSVHVFRKTQHSYMSLSFVLTEMSSFVNLKKTGLTLLSCSSVFRAVVTTPRSWVRSMYTNV